MLKIKVSPVELFLSKNHLCNYYCSNGSQALWPDLAKFRPLWQKFISHGQFFDGLFPIWQNAEPTLANLWHFWAIFHCYKWPNVEKESNHLVTLVTRAYLFHIRWQPLQGVIKWRIKFFVLLSTRNIFGQAWRSVHYFHWQLVIWIDWQLAFTIVNINWICSKKVKHEWNYLNKLMRRTNSSWSQKFKS